jgi:ATPase subunit of ABC transporter with duplicated ATPase domains
MNMRNVPLFVVILSHEKTFLDSLADTIVALKDGKLVAEAADSSAIL